MRVDTGRLRVVAHDAAEAEALPPTQPDNATATGAAFREDGLPSPGAYIEAQRLRRGMSIEQLAVGTKIPARSIRLLEADRFDELPGQVFVKGFLRCCARSLGVSQQAVMDLLYERERAALLKQRDRTGDRRSAVPASPAQTYEGDEDDGSYEDEGSYEDDDVDPRDAAQDDPEDSHDVADDSDDEHVAATSPEALRAATRARRQADVAAKKSEARTRRATPGGRSKRGGAPKRAAQTRPSTPRYATRGGSGPRTAPANELGPRRRPRLGAASAPHLGGSDLVERLRTLVPSAHALLWIVVAIFVAFLVLAAFNLAGSPVGMPQS